MNFSNEIITILDDLAKRFGIAIDWGSENVLPYLRELFDRFIQYNIVTSILWIIIASMIIIATIILLNKYKNFGTSTNRDGSKDYFTRIIVIVVCIGIPILCILCQLFEIVEYIILPELSVYNKFTSLLQ